MSCQRKQTIGAERGSLSKWQAINRAIASGLQPSRTRLDKSAFSLKKFSRSHANDWIMSKRHAKRTELAELNDPSMSLLNNCSSLTMTSILEMWYFLSIAPVLSITVRLNANFHCSRAPQFDGENHDLDKANGLQNWEFVVGRVSYIRVAPYGPPKVPRRCPVARRAKSDRGLPSTAEKATPRHDVRSTAVRGSSECRKSCKSTNYPAIAQFRIQDSIW